MIVSFPPAVRDRLARIENVEGVPAVEIVHQAVDVWSRLDVDGRRVLGIAALQLVVERIKERGTA